MVQAPVCTETDFRRITALIKKRFGISLGPQKRALVISRLQKHIYNLGFRDFAEYLKYVENDPSGKELATLADRISTNHTYFNRESIHFDYLRDTVIPYWESRLTGDEKMRVWSAGCSTGEEAYQIAMILTERFGPLRVRRKGAILATDISREVLRKAAQGRFSADNVARLKKEWIQKYFFQIGSYEFEVKNFLKELILFRRLNLMRDAFPFKRKFHVIFCRNVMIYFDELTRRKLLAQFHRYLMPGGFLFIGHSENLSYDQSFFKYLRPSVYVHEAKP